MGRQKIKPFLGQHRIIVSAPFAQSFAPSVQLSKKEIHEVFPLFDNFRL